MSLEICVMSLDLHPICAEYGLKEWPAPNEERSLPYWKHLGLYLNLDSQ